MKLTGIYKSDKPDKKYYALFDNSKKVYFGAGGYEDYTMHRDSERKKRYIERHRKNENWNDPTTPGSLSRYILWNKPTVRESVIDYRKRFRM